MKKLFEPGLPFPANGEEAVRYMEELAEGILFWKKIDAVILPLAVAAILFALFKKSSILQHTGVIIGCFGLGCPIIMTLGYLFGGLQHLKVMECLKIVASRLV